MAEPRMRLALKKIEEVALEGLSRGSFQHKQWALEEILRLLYDEREFKMLKGKHQWKDGKKAAQKKDE